MTNIAEPLAHVKLESCQVSVSTADGPISSPSLSSKKTPQNGSESPILDTLALLDKNPSRSGAIEPIFQLSETAIATAQKAAAAKYVSGPLAITLAELRSPLEKAYRNTWYCGHIREQKDGVIRTTSRCGNRWCIACNRIRTAKAINRYGPIVDRWAKYFVTLTLPTVTAEELLPTLYGDSTARSAIDERIETAAAAQRTVKRHLKKEGKEFFAVRKLECTARPDGKYHPHFHFIVDGKEAAERLVAEWLRRNSSADERGQDIRPANDRSIVELFKYATKILTDSKNPIAPERLDVIYRALRDRRTWQPVGFRVSGDDGAEQEIRESAKTAWKRVEEQIDWTWKQEVGDWIDLRTGEGLSDHKPTESLCSLSEKFKEERERIQRGQEESETGRIDSYDGTIKGDGTGQNGTAQQGGDRGPVMTGGLLRNAEVRNIQRIDRKAVGKGPASLVYQTNGEHDGEGIEIANGTGCTLAEP